MQLIFRTVNFIKKNDLTNLSIEYTILKNYILYFIKVNNHIYYLKIIFDKEVRSLISIFY
jgi:hypothetical protein